MDKSEIGFYLMVHLLLAGIVGMAGYFGSLLAARMLAFIG